MTPWWICTQPMTSCCHITKPMEAKISPSTFWVGSSTILNQLETMVTNGKWLSRSIQAINILPSQVDQALPWQDLEYRFCWDRQRRSKSFPGMMWPLQYLLLLPLKKLCWLTSPSGWGSSQATTASSHSQHTNVLQRSMQTDWTSRLGMNYGESSRQNDVCSSRNFCDKIVFLFGWFRRAKLFLHFPSPLQVQNPWGSSFGQTKRSAFPQNEPGQNMCSGFWISSPILMNRTNPAFPLLRGHFSFCAKTVSFLCIIVTTSSVLGFHVKHDLLLLMCLLCYFPVDLLWSQQQTDNFHSLHLLCFSLCPSGALQTPQTYPAAF